VDLEILGPDQSATRRLVNLTRAATIAQDSDVDSTQSGWVQWTSCLRMIWLQGVLELTGYRQSAICRFCWRPSWQPDRQSSHAWVQDDL